MRQRNQVTQSAGPAPAQLRSGLLRGIIFLLAALPAVYVFIAIQYAAVTMPFWDHAELIHWIAAWHDGSFQFSSLWAPHNHTRPLVYRFVMVFNAALTDWDIRSEYVYMYLALYGTFACHIWALHRITADTVRNLVYPIVLLLVSLILFSPVGHNNHWWSMMFQLNATNLFIALGLSLALVRPSHWGSQIVAAISCWLASFTLTNGFFAMLAVGLAFQLSAPQLLRPSRWTLFWGGNLLVLLICYLPGISLSSNAAHPTLLQLAQFCLAYLGAPLGGLFWYPFHNMFDIPLSIAANVTCGALLLATYAMLCWHARIRLRQQHGAALILFGFGIFAIVSALATGWARAAFDSFGAATGNSSRYTIFGAYLLIGQLYYLAAGFSRGWWANTAWPTVWPRLGLLAGAIFVSLSLVSYSRAIIVYRDAHHLDRTLLDAFPWGLQHTNQDKLIHPDPALVLRLKRDLQRLELGPYKNRQFDRKTQPIGQFEKAGLLSEDREITQRFIATEDGLKALAITMVTPNGQRKAGPIKWKITELGTTQPAAQGVLDAAGIDDWDVVRLKLPYIGASKGREYQVSFSASADDAHGVGVALYLPVAGRNDTLTIQEKSGTVKTENLALGLRMEYTK